MKKPELMCVTSNKCEAYAKYSYYTIPYYTIYSMCRYLLYIYLYALQVCLISCLLAQRKNARQQQQQQQQQSCIING